MSFATNTFYSMLQTAQRSDAQFRMMQANQNRLALANSPFSHFGSSPQAMRSLQRADLQQNLIANSNAIQAAALEAMLSDTQKMLKDNVKSFSIMA